MKKLFLLTFIAFSFLSCKKEEDKPEPVINETNKIIGYAEAFDFMKPDSNVNGGITVEVLSGSTVIGTATTDSEGRFELPGIKPGTYSATLSKPGYYKYKKKSLIHAAGPDPSIWYLSSPDLFPVLNSSAVSVVLDSVLYVNNNVDLYRFKIELSTDFSELKNFLTSFIFPDNGSRLYEHHSIYNAENNFLHVYVEPTFWQNNNQYGSLIGKTMNINCVIAPKNIDYYYYTNYFYPGASSRIKDNFEVVGTAPQYKKVSITFPQ